MLSQTEISLSDVAGAVEGHAGAVVYTVLHGTAQDAALATRIADAVGLEPLTQVLRAGDLGELAALAEPFCGEPPDIGVGSPAERALAAAFLCRGGFGIAAVRRISGLDTAEDVVRDLVGRGVLAEVDTGAGAPGGWSTRRWTVPLSGLAPARRALERLGSDEAVLRAAHAEFYAGVALTYAERPGTRRRYDELGREGRNIEAALTWLCAADRTTEALTVVETLDPYWRQTGQLEFARDRYVELLRAGAGLDPERVRRLRPAAAAVFARVGEPETARALVPEWPADAAGDLDTAMVAYLQGIVAAADDPDQAVTCYDRAGSGGDPDVAASARLDLALLHLRRQRATTARRVAEEILVRATYGGEDRIAGAALLRLGAIAAVAGPPAAAAGYFHRGLSRLRPLGVAVLTGELVDLIGSYLIEDVAMRTANTARMVGLLHAPRWPTGLLSRPEDLLARLDHRAVRDALLDPTVPLIAALTELAAASFGGGTSETSQAAREALTRRQWEVARCIGDGLTNKQAARRLAISEWTVVNHMREIMRKLKCSSRVQVACWVRERAA